MRRMIHRGAGAIAVIAALAAPTALLGCDDGGPDEAIEELEDEAEDAGDEIEDEIDDRF